MDAYGLAGIGQLLNDKMMTFQMGNNKLYGNERYLVSLCILTYNQESYILEALNGAISQDYKNIEIIISDDNSTDKTFEIIESFVKTIKVEYKIIINRNTHNLGITGNLNKAFELCSGNYILLMAGDDVSYPNRVRISLENIRHTNVLCYTYNANIIDSNSRQKGILIDHIIPSQIFQIEDYLQNKIISTGPTRIINRKLFEIFGPLNEDCPTEDSVYNFRAILAGGLGFINIPVVDYRIHQTNISGKDNLLTKFDPLKIYNQYKKDLDIAYRKKYINDSEYDIYLKHITYYRDRGIALRKLYNSQDLSHQLVYLIKLMFTSKFTMSDKFLFLKSIILWSRKQNLFNTNNAAKN